ncbi:hypothetical protein GGX14DRAFT_562154 [Mycena pura]|uniref:Uncharacterized protein n=1 Tax=Mycena pura TaxID=153505 RepID=A0AAD6VLK7_9AGAR|nr:hypothetical protein GGX14DRAFT_562154 [Mycena pura]
MEPDNPAISVVPTHVGLKKVQPYWYPYTTMAKLLWLDRELLEVVSTKLIDGILCPETIIKNGDRIEEEIICEEPLLTLDRQMGNIVHPEGKIPVSFPAGRCTLGSPALCTLPSPFTCHSRLASPAHVPLSVLGLVFDVRRRHCPATPHTAARRPEPPAHAPMSVRGPPPACTTPCMLEGACVGSVSTPGTAAALRRPASLPSNERPAPPRACSIEHARARS